MYGSEACMGPSDPAGEVGATFCDVMPENHLGIYQ